MKTNATLLIFLTFLIIGCASDKEMRDKFGDDRPHIMVYKSDGNEYIVQHHIGNTYTVQPLIKRRIK